MIQHSTQFHPSFVTGQLLGLERDGVLEVTHSFPIPNNLDAENEESNFRLILEYQADMMHCLRDANVDFNTVGWYQSCYMGSFIGQNMIETQFNYQQNISESVALVFDPERSHFGNICIRAFRLTDAFMAFYKDRKFTLEAVKAQNISTESIFEELPVLINNSSLAKFFLASQSELESFSFDFLNTSPVGHLEKSMELLSELLDEKASEDSKIDFYNKSRKKDESAAAAEPSRLESLLINAQIHDTCKSLECFIEAAVFKQSLETIQ